MKRCSWIVLIFTLGCVMAQERPQMLMSTSVPASTLGGAGFGSGAAGPIGNGDLIEMSVFDTPELSGKLRVSNTGEVICLWLASFTLRG